MHTIGERLEEARKRQGLSIREAAEATKIRSDFLLNMESNLFNFSLPEIYRRGFLRVYATYLKLDPEKLLTDYHAIQLGTSRARRGRGGYGTLEASESEETSPAQPEEIPEESSNASVAVDPRQYIKIAGVLVGVIVLVLVLIAGTRALFSSDPAPAPNPDLVATPASGSQTYTFTAKEDITSLLVLAPDGKKLFTGSLRKGQRESVTFEGAGELQCTQVQNIVVGHNGKSINVTTHVGPGRFALSPATFESQAR